MKRGAGCSDAPRRLPTAGPYRQGLPPVLLAATAKAYRRLPLAATARAYWQVRLVGLVLLLVQVPVKPKVVLALAPSVPL